MFGKSFYTLKEARQYFATKFKYESFTVANGHNNGYGVRKLSKSLFPRRKKRYHVGTYLDFLNFA